MVAWRALLASAFVVQVGMAAKGIWEFDLGVRRTNMLRVSSQTCSECTTLEEFLEAHPFAFLLFFERSLVSVHNYKMSIVNGFHATCADLKFSRIACALVDMVTDPEYATRYINPDHAPGHVIFREGQPVLAQQPHVQRLMERPGDKSAMLWHLHDILFPGASAAALHLSYEVEARRQAEQLLAGREAAVVVAVLGAGAKAGATREAVRAAAQRLVATGEVPSALGAAKEPAKRKSKRKPKQVERYHVAFVIVRSKQVAKALGLEDGTASAFTVGKRVGPAGVQRLPEVSKVEASEAAVAAVLGPLALAAVEAAEKARTPSGEL